MGTADVRFGTAEWLSTAARHMERFDITSAVQGGGKRRSGINRTYVVIRTCSLAAMLY